MLKLRKIALKLCHFGSRPNVRVVGVVIIACDVKNHVTDFKQTRTALVSLSVLPSSGR